jgi:hypothetical protein
MVSRYGNAAYLAVLKIAAQVKGAKINLLDYSRFK